MTSYTEAREYGDQVLTVNISETSARCPNCGEWHDIGTWDPDNIIGINATVTVSCQCGTNFTVGFVM